MAVQLNHTIVWCHDQQRSASFVTDVLGLPAAHRFGPFLVVELENQVSLDFYQQPPDWKIDPQHYAFLISEGEFDGVLSRLNERGLEHWANPARNRPGEINRHDGGRGMYFQDPEGHLLEVITRPYGSGN